METEKLGSIDFLNSILKDAEAQAKQIVAEANEAAKRKLDSASIAIEEIQNNFDSRLQEEKKRLLKNQQNNIEMERRKFELSLRDHIISEAIEKAIELVKDEAASKNYSEVIKQLISEAVLGIGKTQLNVSISSYEEKIVTQPFLDKLAEQLTKEIGTSIQLTLSSTRLRKQGIVVGDVEGRVVYDNQFDTRLVRYQSQIRKAVNQVIAKEVENGN